MKKKILSVAAICAAAISMGACARVKKSEREYAALNEMLDMNYSQIRLTVTEDFGEDSLVGEYVMRFEDGGVRVVYSVERFAEITLDAPAGDGKTTLTGEAFVKDGQVSYVSGDEIGLDATSFGTGLNFKEAYFENADVTGVYLKADVKDAAGFLGTQIECTEMKVMATYLEALYDITVTYKTGAGNSVEYLYEFEQ